MILLTKRIILCFCVFVLTITNLIASEKFSMDGDTLIYDTNKAKDAIEQEITWEDVTEFENLMRENKEIRTLQLNSSGGLIEAASYFSDVIIDYELDTHIDGECASSCVFLFLGGENRSLQRGSWIGFHKSSWSKDNLKDYFELNKNEKGWTDVFEFTEWVYADTQAKILKDMKYLIERGVEGNFAIKTLNADSDDMWYPRRKELIAAGVITKE